MKPIHFEVLSKRAEIVDAFWTKSGDRRIVRSASFSVSMAAGENMLQFKEAPASEHDLYLRLFITNGGGW